MFTILYLFAMLPLVALLFYFLAVVRIWRENNLLAIVMLFFWPAGLFALVRYWGEPEVKVRMPMIGTLMAIGIWIGMLVFGISYKPPNHGANAQAAQRMRGESESARQLKIMTAASSLPLHTGKIEVPSAHASIDVPAHFRFVDRDSLSTLLTAAGGDANDLPGSSVGWLVHESVNLAEDNAWYVEVDWLADGYITEGDFDLRTPEALLAETRRVTSERNTQEGLDADSFRLLRFAELPEFDKPQHTVTWVEEFAVADQEEHELDCYAIKLGRNGAFMYTIDGTSPRRRELCLRSVRLAAARTSFAAGKNYSDHSNLFDHKAGYNLVALMSGATQLTP